jgi:hypothetical protein
MLFFAAIGISFIWVMAMFSIYIIVSIFKAKRLPMDTSNRINHLRLVWFAVSRPQLFVDSFPWLKSDELDNLK